jgi:hypothetical protein
VGIWWDSRSNAFRLTFVVVALLIFVFAFASIRSAMTQAGSPATAPSLSPSMKTGTSPRASATQSTTASATPSPSASAHSRATGDALTFVALLSELPVDDNPSAHTGYNRDLFNAWTDANGDGCDTRAEVLKAESVSATTAHGSCTIDTGSWYSAYDGTWFTDAGEIDIDHFVPLSEAWVSGAWRWSSSTRVGFGNDLGYAASLLAVSASSNRSKSDQDPAHWLPTNVDFYCDYAATWVAVKWRWNLTVDTRERDALTRLLASCSTLTVVLPDRANVQINPNAVDGVAPVGGGGSGDGVIDTDFGTCTVAKANGYGPYIRGVDPEYNFYRDGDSDGTVCE